MKVTSREERVTVKTTLVLDPVPTEAGWSVGPKVATGLQLTWVWDDKWKLSYVNLSYSRVKKDGSLFAGGQDAALYRDDSRDQFADAIEATRPAWEPTPVPSGE